MPVNSRRIARNASFKNSFMCGVSVAALLALGSTSSQAQELVLPGISIFGSASGDNQAFDLPGQVSVVDRDQIEDFVSTRPADVFEGVPGVVFDSGPRRTGQIPTIRGLQGDAVVILFDDARQNFVSGHDGRFFLDPDILIAAEAIKGPTSSIYGSGAIGGVLAFRTITASDLLEDGQDAAARVKYSYNDVDTEHSTSVTAVARSKTGAVDIVGHYGFRNSGDIRLGSGFDLPSDNTINNALAKVTLQLGPAWKSTSSWIFNSLTGADLDNPQFAAVTGREIDRRQISSTFQSKLEFDPRDNRYIDARLIVYRANNLVEEPSADNRTTTRDVVTLGVKGDNTSRFDLAPGLKVKWTYGFDVYRDTQTGDDNFSADGTRGGVPNAQSDFAGVFTEAELRFGEKGRGLGELLLIPGIRFDSFQSSSVIGDDIDETAISPKIAASYSPTRWLTVFGNAGDAFRAPSYNEAYSVGNHFRIPLPGGLVANDFITNPDLQPEDAFGWEAGLSLQFAGLLSSEDSLKIKGSYYRNEVENLIQLEVNTPFGNLSPRCFAPPGTPFPPFIPPCIGGAAVGWTSQNVNVADATIDGVEVEAKYDSKFFFLRATYAQIDGRDNDTGEFAGNLFPDKVFIDAAVKAPAYDIRVGARATFADDFTKVNTAGDERDAYNVFDLYAVWEPKTLGLNGLRVDLGVDNVTDEDYEVVAAGVSEEGRNYKVGVSYRLPFCGTQVC